MAKTPHKDKIAFVSNIEAQSAERFMDHLTALVMGHSRDTGAQAGATDELNDFLASLGIASKKSTTGNEAGGADEGRFTLNVVIELFHKVQIQHKLRRQPHAQAALRLTEEERALWKRLSHPANFDFPVRSRDIDTWAYIQQIATALDKGMKREGEKAEFVFDMESISFFVRALPRPALRRALHKSGVTAAALESKDGEARARALISILASSGHVNARLGEYDEGGLPVPAHEGGKVVSALDHFFPASDALRGRDNRDIRARLKEAMAANSTLTRENMAELYREKSDDIVMARRIAIALTRHMRTTLRQPNFIMPSEVYDLLHRKPEKGVIADPILFAWAEKLRREFELNKDKKAGEEPEKVSLLQAWDEAKTPFRRPRHAGPLRKILAQIDKKNLPFFTAEDLVAEDNDSRTKAAQSVLRRLYDEEPAKKFWAYGWNRAHTAQSWQTTEILRKLARRLGFTKPDYFVTRPVDTSKLVADIAPALADVADDVTQAVAAAPEPAPAVEEPHVEALATPEETEEKPKTAAFYRSHPQEKARLLAEALQLFGTKDSNGKKDILFGTFAKNALDKEGIPSLPHVWVMWAAWPWTREAGMRQMVEAFHDFWEVDGAHSRPFEATARQHFIWAGAAAMRSMGELFENHDRFLAAITRETGAPQKGVTAGNILELLDAPALQAGAAVQELPKLQQRTGEAFLHWADAVAAPASRIFLGSDAGTRFMKRLRAVISPAQG